MSSRPFNALVAIFWVATTSWLLREKILPPLLIGEPPSYRTILQEPTALGVPVSWKMYLDDEPLGWATSTTTRQPDGVTEIRSRVHVARLPLAELTPSWLKSIISSLEDAPDLAELTLAVDAVGSLDIDPLGRPIGFFSTATIGERQAPRRDEEIVDGPGFKVSVRGTIEGNELKLTAKSGDFVYTTTMYLAADALLGDALSPQVRLPDLRVGQSWTMPVYSPLRPPTSPLEILQATVERQEKIRWNESLVPAMVVVFRGVPGSGLTNGQQVRARAWVGPDGNVLEHEIRLLSSRLSFERLPPGEVVAGAE